MKSRSPIATVSVAAVSAVAVTVAAAAIAYQFVQGKRLVSRDVVPTGQILRPVGLTKQLGTRPLDLVVSRDGTTAYVKHIKGVYVIDAKTLEVLQDRPFAGGGSWTGIALSPDESKLAVSDAASSLHVFDIRNRKLDTETTWPLGNAKVGGSSYPLGIAWTPDAVWVALSRDNSVAKLDPSTGTIVKKWPVGVSPFAVLADGSSIVVSVWSPTASGAETAPSAGTPVEVDKRGIAKNGLLVRIDPNSDQLVSRVVGLQPTALLKTDGAIWVSASNDDRVFTFDSEGFRPVAAADVSLGAFGSSPSGLVALADKRIAVALSGKNTVAILQGGEVVSEIPTYWYPLALAKLTNDSGTEDLLVISSKGVGSRSADRLGRGVYDFTGAIARVSVTKDAKPVSRTAQAPKPRPNQTPVPVPQRVGEKSLIEHVVYIIKENRTYDQVFGDLPKGNGEPKLCLFPREVTPNHHAIAEQFVLLDNYYCNGVLSADGHAWTTEAIATAHFERSFGGWTRSYPFGDDPLSTSREGFIWDRALDAGKSFYNYGEFDYASANLNHSQLLDYALANGKAPEFKHNIGVRRIRESSHPTYPGWNMGIPDIVRAKVFLEDFKKRNTLANLTTLYLPQDHTSGGSVGAPTPSAHMADNDLALGQVVDAISKSKFWPKTAIFVVEDDPQDGVDHVDGHRSVCLVISPYIKRGTVNSGFYNQTSVIRTIRHILGLKPMTRFDTLSPLMDGMFQSKPKLTPYNVVPARVSLRAVNVPKKTTAARHNLTKPDMIDEEAFNRDIWETVRPGTRYPAELAGPLEERQRDRD